MPYFSKTSMRRLKECHPHIQKVLCDVITNHDFSVLCGHRDKIDQNAAYYGNPKRTTKEWPNSKHNIYPSIAVDIAPYWKEKPHIRWKRHNEFILLAGIVIGVADSMGIEMRWGGNWDGDEEIITDQTLIDLPHLELVNL